MKRLSITAAFAAAIALGLAAWLWLRPSAEERKLMAMGFPRSYALSLAEVSRRHPAWSFKPLLVTGLDKRYTWEYCLHQETEASPARSLVPAGEAYEKYAHPTDRRIYDSGFRRASAQTVAHFLDPENFLTEPGIFQFMDLGYDPRIEVGHIEAALKGTFMSGLLLENGIGLERYLVLLGRELGVNALHLASRLRQEQGIAPGPLVDGHCGRKLADFAFASRRALSVEEACAYDGLYNFFNIEASGRSRFDVYLSGMKESRKGTRTMAAAWGGSGSWDRRWKAIYGGAEKIARAYVANHQNTLYLQKWNVDARSRTANGRSRNFWGQYMQNVFAARNEAAMLYRSLKENGSLDLPYVFLVPVYFGK
jgi:beta-N-acetylglucosaminidase